MPSSALALAYDALRRGDGRFAARQVRDLTAVELTDGLSLVIAVDSDGGIGTREHDPVQVPEYVLGRFAIRVPLLELRACGALPIAAFDMLSVAMDERGAEIVRGIRDELADAGLGPEFPLSGSTEENVPTTLTGVATAILGIVHEDDFRPGRGRSGDRVLCLGVPRSAPGDRISLEDEEILRPAHLEAALALGEIGDVLPVGSRGVWHEAKELAASAGLEFVPSAVAPIDGTRSAGPSTCAVASVGEDAARRVTEALSLPVFEIGHLSA